MLKNLSNFVYVYFLCLYVIAVAVFIMMYTISTVYKYNINYSKCLTKITIRMVH